MSSQSFFVQSVLEHPWEETPHGRGPRGQVCVDQTLLDCPAELWPDDSEELYSIHHERCAKLPPNTSLELPQEAFQGDEHILTVQRERSPEPPKDTLILKEPREKLGLGLNQNEISPDISKRLQKRTINRDITSLEKCLLNQLLLIYYQGSLCYYKPPRWRRLNDHQSYVLMRSTLQRYGVTSYLTNSEYRKIDATLKINPDIQQEEELQPPKNKLNLLDGTLDLETGQLLPHNPKDGFFHNVNIRFSDISDCHEDGRTFNTFVDHVSNGSPLIRQQLLELVALALTETNVKYFYVLLGPSHTGKTQFCRFLEELVGRLYVESVRGIGDFGDRWTTGSMRDKKLVTCLDLPNAPLPSNAISMVKQIVGDDPIKGEEKYKSPFTMYRKPLLLFAGNFPIRLPKMAQDTAFLNRMVIIPFLNPVEEGDMVQYLYLRLLDEAPYIVGQAVMAYQELMNRNFQVTRSRIPEEYQTVEARAMFNAVSAFFFDCCVVAQEEEISTDSLFAAYRQYAANRGLEQTNQINFSRLFAELLRQEGVGVETVKRASGSGQRGYRGIALKTSNTPA